jgi:hypothetical protein
MTVEIVYEVTINLEKSSVHRTAYLQWLERHISEMLLLPGFQGAQTFEDVQESSADRLTLVVHYNLASQSELDSYFANHAPRMRSMTGLPEEIKPLLSFSRRVLKKVHF